MIDRIQKCVCLSDFRQQARKILSKSIFQYIDSGSQEQITMNRNQLMFHKLMIIPRVLVSNANPIYSTSIFNKKLNLPFGLAPWAMNTIVHPQGQNISAKIAYQKNIIFTLSTLSTKSFAQIQKQNNNGFRLMQMYVSNDWNLTQTIIKLAEKYNFTGLAITVDAQVLGIRRRQKKTILDSSTYPFPVLQQIHNSCQTKNQYKQRKSLLANRDLTMNWDTIKKIRSFTKLKIILKGIMSYEDAQKAVQYCDAVWISNHGGRQLDSIPSTIQVLPKIKAVIGNKLPIFIDGGVRTGNDIFKCLALGADYVFIGRPTAYCLTFGAEGVTKMVNILQDQLSRCMKLSGCKNLQQVRRSRIVQSPSL